MKKITSALFTILSICSLLTILSINISNDSFALENTDYEYSNGSLTVNQIGDESNFESTFEKIIITEGIEYEDITELIINNVEIDTSSLLFINSLPYLKDLDIDAFKSYSIYNDSSLTTSAGIFINNTSIKNVTFDNLMYIDDSTFYNSSIETFTSNTLLMVESKVFANTSNLSLLDTPNLVIIGDNFIDNTPKLEFFTIAENPQGITFFPNAFTGYNGIIYAPEAYVDFYQDSKIQGVSVHPIVSATYEVNGITSNTATINLSSNTPGNLYLKFSEDSSESFTPNETYGAFDFTTTIDTSSRSIDIFDLNSSTDYYVHFMLYTEYGFMENLGVLEFRTNDPRVKRNNSSNNESDEAEEAELDEVEFEETTAVKISEEEVLFEIDPNFFSSDGEVTTQKLEVDNFQLDIPSNILIEDLIGDVAIQLNTPSPENFSYYGLDETFVDEFKPLVTIDVNLLVDNMKVDWANENSSVRITTSIPDTVSESIENYKPENIFAIYINEDGNNEVMDTFYDSDSGAVSFDTNHFSVYTFAYLNDLYTDIDDYVGAKKAIYNLTVNGIIKGTGDNKFSPNREISRGEYMYILMNILALDGVVSDNYSDVLPHAFFYTSTGVSKNLNITPDSDFFYPSESISETDILSYTSNALYRINKEDLIIKDILISGESSTEVSDSIKRADAIIYLNDVFSSLN